MISMLGICIDDNMIESHSGHIFVIYYNSKCVTEVIDAAVIFCFFIFMKYILLKCGFCVRFIGYNLKVLLFHQVFNVLPTIFHM